MALRKGHKALTTLVGAVALDAQGGWGIGAPKGAEMHALPASEAEYTPK
ncbi:MAG: hypothetical protein GWP44_09700 [Proteobacteria bacterium]|nr:hypothetical protein [Pseudomonadota bacterium]